MNPPDDEPIHLRLRRTADQLGADPVTLGHVADAHGPAALGTMMIMLAAPCMLPLPGVGTVLGMGLVALSVSLWQGRRDAGLPAAVYGFGLSAHWARRVLHLLARFHALAARWARRRGGRWGHGDDGDGHDGDGHYGDGLRGRCLAIGAGAMAILIVLPIPFGNVLPAAALMLLGLGLVFRDSLALLLASGTGLLALAYTVGLGWMAWLWGMEPLMRLLAV